MHNASVALPKHHPFSVRASREEDVLAIIVSRPGILTEEIQQELSLQPARRVSEALARLRRRCVVEWQRGRGNGWYPTGLPIQQDVMIDLDVPWGEDLVAKIAVDECPDGMHMQTIAELTGISRQRVEQIIHMGMVKVKHAILKEQLAAKRARDADARATKRELKVDWGLDDD